MKPSVYVADSLQIIDARTLNSIKSFYERLNTAFSFDLRSISILQVVAYSIKMTLYFVVACRAGWSFDLFK